MSGALDPAFEALALAWLAEAARHQELQREALKFNYTEEAYDHEVQADVYRRCAEQLRAAALAR